MQLVSRLRELVPIGKHPVTARTCAAGFRRAMSIFWSAPWGCQVESVRSRYHRYHGASEGPEGQLPLKFQGAGPGWRSRLPLAFAGTGSMSSPKSILGVLPHRSEHWVGDGFQVRNLFPSNALGEKVGPFLLLDYFGPTQFNPTTEKRGIGEHPHRGFETVTLLFEGEVAHRDSAGNAGTIGPGDVQWMTAAKGIVHEEFHGPDFAAKGGIFHGVQLWVNLPSEHKLDEPRYQELKAAEIPEVDLGSGSLARIVAGELAGTRGPAMTFTPLNLWELRLQGGAPVELAVPEGHATAVAVLRGSATVEGAPTATDAQIVVLGQDGVNLRITAEDDTRALLLSGKPLGEPVVSHGPFVMNTKAEIHQAVRDFQSGTMGRLS